jgi:hypothetical protein
MTHWAGRAALMSRIYDKEQSTGLLVKFGSLVWDTW